MERTFVLDETRIPIDELEKALSNYLQGVRQAALSGETHVALPTCRMENGDGTIASTGIILEVPKIPPCSPLFFSPKPPLLFPPIIPPRNMSCTCTCTTNGFFAKSAKNPYPRARVPRTQDDENLNLEDLPKKRSLNRGMPAPPKPIAIDYSRNGSTNKKLLPVRITNRTMQVLSYWNDKPSLPRHILPKDGLGTKLCKQADTMLHRLFSGTLFLASQHAVHNRKYTMEELFAAIDKFDIVCTSVEYEPRNKESIRRLGFTRFLYDTITGLSWFLKCVNDDLKRTVEIVMPNTLRVWYDTLKEAYLSSRSSSYKYLSDSDMENLRDASKLLYGFQRRVSNELVYAEASVEPLTPITWCAWLFAALDYKISPSRLADPRSCNYFLYTYLLKKGRLPGTQVEEQEPPQETPLDKVQSFSIYERNL